MKITKVQFVKLFGIFDHVVEFNQKGGVTIVIGENGLGKTVILDSINSLFNRKYSFFGKLHFEKFIVHFDTNESWSIRKGKSKNNSDKLYLIRGVNGKNENNETEIKTNIKTDQKNKDIIKSSYLRREYLRRKFMGSFIDEPYLLNEYLNIENELLDEKFNEMYGLRNGYKNVNPQWYEDTVDVINVRLIETQRIISTKDLNSETILNSVDYCSKELKDMISKAVKESSDVASKLDSTYPNRLIKELKTGADNSFEELNSALAKLNDRRKLLSSVGLITESNDNDLLQIEHDQEDIINVLKIYIDDSHKKLAPFEEISKKIKIFKEIINTRFKHKKIEITQNEGLVFKSTVVQDKNQNDLMIPSSGLSSGEQNELILFYKLIFNSQKNDLILIDEPELSLHISWQNKFIDDIKDIISINGLSVMIATHSPDIISENWNLTVELLGVE
ncbi:TPA: AAA family ATPase [Klebsiella aerogenes]|nr:AAA family ATPase [Klebsiella aerogenes]